MRLANEIQSPKRAFKKAQVELFFRDLRDRIIIALRKAVRYKTRSRNYKST